jgi:16S rRNA (uracil1498-N3)-methyltransferase
VNGEVLFPEEQAHQINRVLRLSYGEKVIILDNLGNEYEVELVELGGRKARGIIHSCYPAEGEPWNQVWLYIAITQREKFEWILQKCTEIGVMGFVPIISSRCLGQSIREVEEKRTRWERILREAAEQSGRGRIPSILPALPIEKGFQEAGRNSPAAFIFWEKEQKLSFSKALKNITGNSLDPGRKTVIMIGPEGGFTDGEMEKASESGLLAVTLGRRVLRMETAAVVAAALVFYERGEMG